LIDLRAYGVVDLVKVDADVQDVAIEARRMPPRGIGDHSPHIEVLGKDICVKVLNSVAQRDFSQTPK
jgi:hypothetical protein